MLRKEINMQLIKSIPELMKRMKNPLDNEEFLL